MNKNSKAVAALAKIRREWEEAADGECLMKIDGSVGLILADVAEALGLSEAEMVEALGPRLKFDTTDLLAVFVE